MRPMMRLTIPLAILIVPTFLGVHYVQWIAAQRRDRSAAQNEAPFPRPETSDTPSRDATVSSAGGDDPVDYGPSRNTSIAAGQDAPALPSPQSPTSDVPLPSPIADREMTRTLAILERNQVYRAQDKIMETWPKYSEVREQLQERSLNDKDLEEPPTERLVDTALQLRDMFWKAGGCLSPSAVIHAYNARRLLEQAHDREPGNMAITDALVETIQATWVCGRSDPQSKQWIDAVMNDETAEDLLRLRSTQFSQMKKEEQGRRLAWEDFARINDLAWLAHRRGDLAQAREALEWLVAQAPSGGWQAYLSPLRKWLGTLETDTYNYNIYTSMDEPRDKYTYGRRLPSFKGPRPDERGVRPVHELVYAPVWSSGQSRRAP